MNLISAKSLTSERYNMWTLKPRLSVHKQILVIFCFFYRFRADDIGKRPSGSPYRQISRAWLGISSHWLYPHRNLMCGFHGSPNRPLSRFNHYPKRKFDLSLKSSMKKEFKKFLERNCDSESTFLAWFPSGERTTATAIAQACFSHPFNMFT